MIDVKQVELGLVLSSQFAKHEDPVLRFEEQLEQVRFARDAGFSGVYASQHYLAHPFQYLQPLPVLARIIPEAGEMRIGTSIALLALPNPVDLAEQLTTLDVLSRGNLTVGVGLGYRDVEFNAFGVSHELRLRRFLDNLEVLRELWTADQASFTGDHVRLDRVPIAMRPVQRPHPPIWMAGHSEGAIRRAARRGFPWIAAAAHVQDSYLQHQVLVYRKACAEFGHPELDLPMAQEVYVASTEERALEVVQRSLAEKYRAYAEWGQDSVLPQDQTFHVEFEKLRQSRFIVGDPKQCVSRINELVNSLRPTHLLLRMQWPGMSQHEVMEGMSLFVDKVMPSLDLGALQ